MEATLEATALSKHFRKDDREIVALRGVDLRIEPSSFVTVLGRSGCGKSTLLNLMAGLATPTKGTVRYHGADVKGPRPELGYLTQSDTLMPWRDVRRNVEMPLEIRGLSARERRKKAAELIEKVGLAGFEHHYPRELSGGMRRRASLARLLCGDPETLLLDEPFAALDAQLRADLQRELLRLWAESRRTVVFVTHDLDEALLLADRVILLGPVGRVELDITVDLPRPREPDGTRLHPHFLDLHRKLATALKQAQR